MANFAKDVTSSILPLTVAFAEEARVEEFGAGTPYNTYTTDSGNWKSPDDAPIKDED